MSSIRIPKTATAAEILAHINKWADVCDGERHLNEGYTVEDRAEREKLWNVLAALRGPDVEDMKLKERYTVQTRAVLSNLARVAGAYTETGVNRRALSQAYNRNFAESSGPGVSHFMHHWRLAAKAIFEILRERYGTL